MDDNELREDDRYLAVTLAESSVPLGTLIDASTPEVAMLLLSAMANSRTESWGAPNIAIHAYTSVDTQVRRSSGRTNRSFKELIVPVVTDAMAWLIAGGLIGPSAWQSGSGGEWSVTAAGRQALERSSTSHVEASRRLHTELHPALEDARLNFERGQLQLAVFAAMLAVEMSVAEAANLGPDFYGVDLVRKALGPQGPIPIEGLKAEQEAFMHLVAGAIGALKNPSSHRAVRYDDPAEAADALHLADLLLRVLDREKQRRALASSDQEESVDR